MQHSQPYITFYWEVILLIWGGNILRKVELLMIVLSSLFLVSFGPSPPGGLTIILCISMNDTYNNNFQSNCSPY